MKRLLPFLLICCFTRILSAIEPGGLLTIEDLAKQAEAVNVSASPVPQKNKAPYKIIFFFDIAARDSAAYLAMLSDLQRAQAELPQNEQADFFLLTRGSGFAVKSLIRQYEISMPIHADSKQTLFKEYAAGELLLPFALIGKEGKIIWKGSPIDLENILNLIRTGKFNPDIQLKVTRLRKEMQMAVQASLPDVILRCANEILKLQPGDSLAIQAKLFVFENSNRFPAALAFARQNAQANPHDVKQTLLYLNYLQRGGNRLQFMRTFEDAVKQFRNSPEALFRLMAFAAGDTVSLSWFPLNAVKALPDQIRTVFEKQPADRRSTFYQYEAAIHYGLCDIQRAVHAQKMALILAVGRKKAEISRQLEFYQNIQRLQQEKSGK